MLYDFQITNNDYYCFCHSILFGTQAVKTQNQSEYFKFSFQLNSLSEIWKMDFTVNRKNVQVKWIETVSWIRSVFVCTLLAAFDQATVNDLDQNFICISIELNNYSRQKYSQFNSIHFFDVHHAQFNLFKSFLPFLRSIEHFFPLS